MQYKTIGSKNIADRLFVLFLGIAFLTVLNMQMFGGIDALLMLATVISGWFLYKKITLFKNTHYVFDKKYIEITTGKKKSYKIPVADIESITPVKLGWVPFKGWGKTVDYSTSSANLLSIITKDQVTILISPRKVEPWIRSIYPFKQEK